MEVCKRNQRKSGSARIAYYGGIATADCMAVHFAGVTERAFLPGDLERFTVGRGCGAACYYRP